MQLPLVQAPVPPLGMEQANPSEVGDISQTPVKSLGDAFTHSCNRHASWPLLSLQSSATSQGSGEQASSAQTPTCSGAVERTQAKPACAGEAQPVASGSGGPPEQAQSARATETIATRNR